jgi:PAS domain S-box-containing protein/putative nucleotidyltransferase with HDIG domain
LAELRKRVAELEALQAGPQVAKDGPKNRSAAIDELPEFRLRWPFHQLFESMPDAYYLQSLDGAIADANRATEELTGYPRRQLVGKSFSDLNLLSEADAARATGLLARNAVGDVTGPDEFVFQRRDGGQVVVEIRGLPLRIRGEPFVLGMVQDAARDKRAEDLRESEELYRDMVEEAGIGILTDDTDGKVTYCNTACAQLFGYSVEEMQGQSIASIAHPDDVEEILRLHSARVRGEMDHSRYEFRGVRKDGATVFLMVDTAPLKDGDGIIGTRATMWDITEQRRIEEEFVQQRARLEELVEEHTTEAASAAEALRKSEETCRSLTENISVGIYRNTVGPEGEFIEANPAVVRMFGYGSREEFLAARVSDLYQDPEDRKALNDKMLSVGFVENERLQLRKKDGTPFIGSVSAVAVKDERGEVQYYDGVIEDITDRGRAEQDLHQSEARFAAFMDNLPAGVYIKDEHSRFLYVNRYLQDRFDADVWLRQISVHHFPKVIAEAMIEDDRRVLKEGPLVAVQAVVDKSGAEHVFQTHKFPISQDGGPILLGGIAVDVTERERAEDQLRRNLKRIQSDMEAVVQAMVHTVEARDPYTAGHQRRVAQLACAIGKTMGFPEEQLRGLRIAGLVHDIGKITTPGALLSKPDRLNQPEVSIIQRHPHVGYDILKTIDFSWPIAEIIAQHHERIDGSGYPQGLSCEDILLEARILGVADVVEAMASHRPYRAAPGIEKALQEITAHTGTLYDPLVVEACLHVFEKERFEFEEQELPSDEPTI